MKKYQTIGILLAAGCAALLAGGLMIPAMGEDARYTVRFDPVCAGVFLPSAESGAGEEVDLPACESKQFGGLECEFLYWADAATGEKVSDPFVMPGRDVSLYAVYGNGMLSGESDYMLTERGYVPVKTAAQGGLSGCALTKDDVYSVEMVLPADPAAYKNDCGPTFAAESYDGGFSNYLQLFVTRSTLATAGNLQLYLITNATVKLQEISLSSLWGTRYYEAFTSWQEKGGETALSFTVRPDAAARKWAVGIEGEELLTVSVGDNAALTASYFDHTYVGFRSKASSVRFFAPRVTPADALSVTLDANGGTLDGGALEKQVSLKETSLPTPSREGYTFQGWFTLSASGEEVYHTSGSTLSPGAVCYAKWTDDSKETAGDGGKIYTLEIVTEIEGYTVEIPYYQIGSKVRIPKLRYEGVTFGSTLYYDAEFRYPVDFSDFNIYRADTAGDSNKISLYIPSSGGADDEGGENNPYLLSSSADLKKFASDVNGGETFAGKYFKMTQNIDLQNAEWTPISGNFLGTFDGGNFEISNVKIANGKEHVGLFSKLTGGTFRNLKLNVDITASGANAGALAGSVSGGTVTVESVEVSGSVTANERAGGLFGWVGETSGGPKLDLHIKDCVNRAAITSKSSYAAGIIASKDGTTAVIESCKNYGAIAANGTTCKYVGGIVGILRVGTGTTVKDCYNFGNITVSAGAQYVSGIAGLNRARVENCYMLETATITRGTTVYVAKTLQDIGDSTTCGRLASHETNGSPVVVGGGLCTSDGSPV